MSLQGWHSNNIYAHLSNCDQNSFEVSRWYRTMTAKQVWRDIFSGQTDRSLLRRLELLINQCELEEWRSDHRITITVVSVDFVLMYNTGILVETLALKKCSSRRKSLAELCSFSQLSFVQNNNYSERVCCQYASKIRTLYDCFSFVKSFMEKEECNDLDKAIEINESWRTTTIASINTWKWNADFKTKFFGLEMLHKNQRANSRTN